MGARTADRAQAGLNSQVPPRAAQDAAAHRPREPQPLGGEAVAACLCPSAGAPPVGRGPPAPAQAVQVARRPRWGRRERRAREGREGQAGQLLGGVAVPPGSTVARGAAKRRAVALPPSRPSRYEPSPPCRRHSSSGAAAGPDPPAPPAHPALVQPATTALARLHQEGRSWRRWRLSITKLLGVLPSLHRRPCLTSF